MPKIEVLEKTFFELVGRKLEDKDEFEDLLQAAKAELDEWKRDGEDERTIKIELNDTNRPDLWSTAGLARSLRVYLGGKRPAYPFFSRKGDLKEAGNRRVIVDPKLKDIRPYIAAFVISGKPISDAMLRDVIQTQEKLCGNYGRKRKSIAMGVYRSEIMRYPVHYSAADPDKTSFVPLGMETPLSLRRILAEHPKGIEFGPIVAAFPAFPYLSDDRGGTLSFPPVINSAEIGAVRVGDRDLFVEMTGTDLPTLTVACNIVACDFADAGYDILPVRIEYPYDTPFGRAVVTPFYFQEPVAADLAQVRRITGVALSMDEVGEALARMGNEFNAEGERVTVRPAGYRNDFLHAVDVIEDVIIGRGMKSFAPEPPRDFTIGRVTPLETFSRKAKNVMVGLGFQEMVYNYLGSGRDLFERMNGDGAELVRIANPMSESFEYLRSSILPSLLNSESVSSRAAYPHLMFEIGKVCFKNAEENHGVSTRCRLGWFASARDANYNLAASQLNTLLFFLSREYSLAAAEDGRFVPGRAAVVNYRGKEIGRFGEIHPAVLENWGITVPCVAGEIDLEALI
jgi:phenylalanyl-tRNA synthetase beta chain